MGVPGLTTYVEGNRNFFHDLKFSNSALVIDGCSLYFRLYFSHGLDQQHGGDYDAFSTLLDQFFSALAACNIQPFVVLDGGMDPSDKKFSTLRERLRSKIKEAESLSHGRHGSVLPLLTREVFIQVLTRMGVPLVQCPAEADWEIACLACQWKCPVLTNDSDFYVFDLPGGYLPFNFFNWTHLRGRAPHQFISARCYTTQLLCRWFGGLNEQLLPLCAALIGNDYGTPRCAESLFALLDLTRGGGGGGGRGASKPSSTRIEGLLSWLSSFPGPREALGEISRLLGESGIHGRVQRGREEQATSGKAHSLLWASMQEYCVQSPSSLAMWFTAATPPRSLTAPLPMCLGLDALRGLLPPLVRDVVVMRRVLLYPQVENSRQASSHECARAIRQVVYGLLLQSIGAWKGADAMVPVPGKNAQAAGAPGGIALAPHFAVQGTTSQGKREGTGRGRGRGRGGRGGGGGGGGVQDQALQMQPSIDKDGVGSWQGDNGGPSVANGSAPVCVEEYDREHLNLKRNQVELPPPDMALQLDALGQAPLKVRKTFLLDVLGVKESALTSISPNLWLAVGVTAFWCRKASPSLPQYQALILGMVCGEVARNNQSVVDPQQPEWPATTGATYNQWSSPQFNWVGERGVWGRLDRLRVRPGERRGLDVGGAHAYSQWQACLWSTTCLNHLLLQPLPDQQIPWLFSGSLVHGLLKNLSGGRTAESLLDGGPLSGQLYCSLLDAVRKCNSKTQASSGAGAVGAGGRGKRGNRKGRRGRGRGRGGGADLSNRFAFLMVEEEFEEDDVDLWNTSTSLSRAQCF